MGGHPKNSPFEGKSECLAAAFSRAARKPPFRI